MSQTKPQVDDSLLYTSRFYRFNPATQAYTWHGVAEMVYKTGEAGFDFQDVTRNVIFGHTEKTGFNVRYFEVAPGGYSSLEKHTHTHGVICIRGKGHVLVGSEIHEMNFLDALYLAPDTPHQFVADMGEPLGFLCVVDAERDRPRHLEPQDVAAIRANPIAAATIRSLKPRA